MRFCYGNKNVLRILEEAEFWKRQESEHTVVIRQIVPDLEDKYEDVLEKYQEVFNSCEAEIIQYIETIINCGAIISPEMYDQVVKLIEITVRQSQMFVDLLGEMLEESEAVEENPVAIVVINHIRRESKYYIGMANAFLKECNCYKPYGM